MWYITVSIYGNLVLFMKPFNFLAHSVFWAQENHKKYLKSTEKEKWSLIDYNYMIEESGDEDSDVVRQHKLVCCSEGTACDYNQVLAWLLFIHSLCVHPHYQECE